MAFADDFLQRAKLDIFDSIDIHTNVDDHTFALLQSGYATYFNVRGAKEILGDDELQRELSLTIERLRKFLNAPGHEVEVSLTRDPDRGPDAVRRALAPSIQAAQTMGLDAGFLFKDKINKLGQYVSDERGLLVFKTSIFALPTAEREKLLNREAKKGRPKVLAKYGADPSIELAGALRTLHDKACEFFIKMMSRTFVLERLTVRDALRRLRMEIAPDVTSSNWAPRVWGDTTASLGHILKDPEDVSPMLPPAFGIQLFPQKPFLCEEDRTIFRVGNRYIAPLTFFLLPQYPVRFAALFDSLGSSVPFRLNIAFETGGTAHRGRLSMKKNIATLLSLADSSNKAIANSANYVLSKIDNENVPLLLVRAHITTWGGSLEEVQERKQQLIQEVSAWGGPELRDVAEFTWDPWIESLPGLALRKRAPACLYPADELLSVLPMDRPAEGWTSGGFLLRSDDGKLLPQAMFSGQQTTWNGLTFALPGSGKSVLVLARKLAEIMAAGNSDIPYQALFDIGFSCEGYIDLLKAILPPDKKDYAILVQMELSRTTVINPFDTALGCDMPLPAERQFAIDFMQSLVMNAESATDEVVLDAAAMFAKRMYEYKFENPSQYHPRMDQRVDRLLEDNNHFDLPREPFWREVRDALFKSGYVKEAGTAHRFSVPNLGDASTILNNDHAIKSAYERSVTSSGEPVLEVLRRQLAEAVSTYVNMAGPSTFDFGRARVIAFNLRAVADDTTPQRVKQTCIMYALADKAAASSFFTDGENLSGVPELYHEYHKRRFAELAASNKSKLYEEFHVPASMGAGGKRSPIVRKVETEKATGRKYSVGIDAVTQRLETFSTAMVDNASSFFVLDTGTEQNLAGMRKLFGLRESVTDAMRTHLTGPTSDGAPVTIISKVKKRGTLVQNSYLTLGSAELWCLCSTKEDVYVRRALSRRVGFKKAIAVLSSRFPGGTLKEEAFVFQMLLNEMDPSIAKPATKQWVQVFSHYLLEVSDAEMAGLLDRRSRIRKDLVRNALSTLESDSEEVEAVAVDTH